MKRKIFLSAVILVMILVPMLGAGPVPTKAAEMPKAIRMSAGAMGQSPYLLLGLLSRWMQEAMPGLTVQVIAGGGKANINLVDTGTADIAFTTTTIYADALNGKGDFKKKYTSLRVLCNIQGYNAFYFMVTQDTGLTSIREFIKKKYPLKIATFLKTGPPEITTRRLLNAYGVTYADVEKWGGKVTFCQWGDCVNLLRDGHVNALLGNTSLPSSFHEEAAKARPMRMLPVDKAIIDQMVKKYGYTRVTIPKGTYGIVAENMPSLGAAYFFFTDKRLNDKIAYEVIKQMADHPKEIRSVHSTFRTFVPKKMVDDLIGPIHPGALKYYKERGWIK